MDEVHPVHLVHTKIDVPKIRLGVNTSSEFDSLLK